MTTISDYVKNNSQTDRQKHIDLKTACVPSVQIRNTKSSKMGEYSSANIGTKNAVAALKGYLNLSGSTGFKINTCHLCVNSSAAPNGFVCTNPQHLYFGTVKENNNDLDPNGKPTGGRAGGKASNSQKQKDTASKNAKTAIANGTHPNQQTHTCPHCNKTGKGGGTMKRWHFDRCKLKP